MAIVVMPVRYTGDDWLRAGGSHRAGSWRRVSDVVDLAAAAVQQEPAPPVVIGQPIDPAATAPATSPTDETLLARMRGGQVSAGEELVGRYYSPLVRYLHRLIGSESAAEELHQQTWLSVLEHLEKFDARRSGGFKSWLFRIATNKANDHWRSAGRERAVKSGLRLIADEQMPAADHRLQAAEQERKLAAAIAQLPEHQRQVLLLRYYGNLKFVEIADVLGCPLNTALGRMHKAMLKLKEMMGS
jgi:RNA polymerase sigma factor (sigma-70 family)